MTSGNDGTPWYAFSLATYQSDIGRFLRTAEILARSLARAYGARPHWGKICPLNGEELGRLYPRLSEFRHCCASVDPLGVFINDFARSKLALASSGNETGSPG
jgi:hypothetical protein